jgi:hypothetical protein
MWDDTLTDADETDLSRRKEMYLTICIESEINDRAMASWSRSHLHDSSVHMSGNMEQSVINVLRIAEDLARSDRFYRCWPNVEYAKESSTRSTLIARENQLLQSNYSHHRVESLAIYCNIHANWSSFDLQKRQIKTISVMHFTFIAISIDTISQSPASHYLVIFRNSSCLVLNSISAHCTSWWEDSLDFPRAYIDRPNIHVWLREKRNEWMARILPS